MSRKLILASGLAAALAFLALVPSASAQVILPMPRLFVAPALSPAARAPVTVAPAAPVVATPVIAAPANGTPVIAPPPAAETTSFYRGDNGQITQPVMTSETYYSYPVYYRRGIFFRRWWW